MDPDLFRSVDEQTRAFNAELEATLAALPPLTKTPPEAARRAREEGKSVFGPLQFSSLAVDRTIRGPEGDLPLRVFLPEDVEGVYLHIHGGGWVLGGPHHQDPRLEALARACRVAVVSVGYRLAPEHPYPAAPDDCEAAARWLIEHATAEFGTSKLLVGGESAGAHLSAVTLCRLRDRHGFTGVLAANLLYGSFDLSLTPSAAGWGQRNLILSTPIIHWFADHFVDRERRRHPDVSPLYADLEALPPALFTVGTLDPLLDDSLFMHARWVAAGNRAELAVYPGAVHAFDAFPIALAERAHHRIHEFLTSALGAD